MSSSSRSTSRRYARACGAAGFTVDDPAQVAATCCGRRSTIPGPAVVEAVVDPNEPPLPGKITTEQALKFAEALLKGERERWKIFKTVAENKVREVI